tara:strand:- start:1064 stop:1594 length:531 start_codon:yes stop_codon:yes gene_type:complete
MAKTKLQQYSVQEKLNKMDVDLIDISATLTSDGTSGDLMFDVTEIPYAVSVNGGAGILQSVVAIVTDNSTDASGDGANITGGFKLVITSDSTSIGSVSDAIGADTSTRAVLDGICCITDITYVTDHGYFGVFSKDNIGAIVKAASGSTSLYAYGITSSTNDYNGATITLRLGFVKD